MPFRKIKCHELKLFQLVRLSRVFEGACFVTTISQSHDAAASQIIAPLYARCALATIA